MMVFGCLPQWNYFSRRDVEWPMSERATTQVFGLALSALLLGMLVLNVIS